MAMIDDDPFGGTEDGVYFQYCGYFSQAVIEQSVDELSARGDQRELDPRVGRRLINAFIEVSQNIVHYSHDALTSPDQADGEIRFGSVEITEEGGGFFVSSSNPVSEQAAERLRDRLSELVTLDQDMLKQRYQAALRSDGEPGSKGGGIGFLRLARGSSSKLQFSFVDAPINPDIKIFNLTVTVS
jgi:hypothetical protein